jgi:uncharacterized protein YjiS (DUF1127 family)
VHFENHFHGRSSRLLALRRGDSAIFGARKTLAERSEGAGQYSHRQIHRAVIQGPRGGGDGSFRASSDRSWRDVSAAVSNSITKAAAVLGTCRELRLCRVLDEVVSWIFKQAFEGCAAYAAAMYGIPVGELRDCSDPADEPQTSREHTDRRLASQPSGEISANAKGNVLSLAESRIARLEAEFVAPPQPVRVGSPGWIASISPIVAKIRSQIRQRRERRLAAELQCFDDRSLRDIGISRCDIEYLVRHGDRRE